MTALPLPSEIVPTLSEWGTIILTFILAIVAIVALKAKYFRPIFE